MRSLVDDPGRRERLTKQLDRALRGLDALDAVASFVKVFEHGYGRPPQALDIRTNDGQPVIHQVTFGGAPAPPGGHPGVSTTAGVPTADLRLGGTD